MRRNLFLLIFCAVLAACRPATPAATLTLQASPSATPAVAAQTVTATVSETLTHTSSPIATSTPLPAGMLEFIFPHYESLAVAYASSLWQSDKGMGQGLLSSRTIPGCEISDTSPQPPPEPQYSTRIGALDYQTTRQKQPSGPSVTWYFPPADLATAVPEDALPVYLVVTSPTTTEEECRQAAVVVLATLGASSTH